MNAAAGADVPDLDGVILRSCDASNAVRQSQYSGHGRGMSEEHHRITLVHERYYGGAAVGRRRKKEALILGQGQRDDALGMVLEGAKQLAARDVEDLDDATTVADDEERSRVKELDSGNGGIMSDATKEDACVIVDRDLGLRVR